MTTDEINVNNSELATHVNDCYFFNRNTGNLKTLCNLETTTRVKTTYENDIQFCAPKVSCGPNSPDGFSSFTSHAEEQFLGGRKDSMAYLT